MEYPAETLTKFLNLLPNGNLATLYHLKTVLLILHIKSLSLGNYARNGEEINKTGDTINADIEKQKVIPSSFVCHNLTITALQFK